MSDDELRAEYQRLNREFELTLETIRKYPQPEMRLKVINDSNYLLRRLRELSVMAVFRGIELDDKDD